MGNEPKPNLTGLIAGIIVLLVILLPVVLLTASCSGTTSHEQRDTACTYVEDFYQCDVTLDGRKITCLRFNSGTTTGSTGLSCDWNHVSGEDSK